MTFPGRAEDEGELVEAEKFEIEEVVEELEVFVVVKFDNKIDEKGVRVRSKVPVDFRDFWLGGNTPTAVVPIDSG